MRKTRRQIHSLKILGDTDDRVPRSGGPDMPPDDFILPRRSEPTSMRLKARACRLPSWPIAEPILAACMITLVAGVAIVGQGDFHLPPRYDGAGYAVLARSLAEGSGYRAIDHPDRPRHAHFPPGYPLFLATLWRVMGYSVPAAHIASLLCSVGATLAAWLWFRRIYPRDVALVLGLALANNWAWGRAGSGIQSEPLYGLLCLLTILWSSWWVGRVRAGPLVLLGALLAACLMTRQVAIGLTLAVLTDLAIGWGWRRALAVGATTAVLFAPWVSWLVLVGASERTQASLLIAGSSGFFARLGSQFVFYLQRIPDQITGPIVEITTVIRPSAGAAAVANLWAVAVSAVAIWGWIRAIRQPRRRLAGLVPLLTLGLLLTWPYTEAGRFLIPLIPCLLIGAVEGTSGLIRRLKGSLGLKCSRRRARFVAAVVLLVASIPFTAHLLLSGRSRARDPGTRAFDMACAWIVEHADRPGPILTRHPGEVFLATGRQALEVTTSERASETDASPDAIAQTIANYGVAYLLVDEDRYLNAPPSPLHRFVAVFPHRLRLVWSSEPEPPVAAIYEVLPSPELGFRAGALEPQRPVVLVAMEAGLSQRRGAHENRLGSRWAVIVAADCEEPGIAGLRLGACEGEGRPGNAALDGPASVLVTRLIQGPIHHGDSPGAEHGPLIEDVGMLASAGEGHLEDEPTGIGLKLEVLRTLGAGFEEQLEDVAIPERVVAMGAVCLDLGVGHGSRVIQGLVVPDQIGSGPFSRRLRPV
jgi:hypothetical protein